MTGRLYQVAVGALGIGIGLLLAALLVVNGFRFPPAAGIAPSPTPSPAPSPTEPVHPLMAVPIPVDAECAACHLGGGAGAIVDIPRMAHPVEGWRNCTACHEDTSLVPTAPGHTGIGKQLCLACHEAAAADASALPRPHHVVTGSACVTCHGVEAPLPTDMIGRRNCWVCHPDQDSQILFEDPLPRPSP